MMVCLTKEQQKERKKIRELEKLVLPYIVKTDDGLYTEDSVTEDAPPEIKAAVKRIAKYQQELIKAFKNHPFNDWS